MKRLQVHRQTDPSRIKVKNRLNNPWTMTSRQTWTWTKIIVCVETIYNLSLNFFSNATVVGKCFVLLLCYLLASENYNNYDYILSLFNT